MLRAILFQLNPEVAHRLSQFLIQLRYNAHFSANQFNKPISVFGLNFKNPIGMAAGWDKNADCFDALFRMGFGFVEVGGVTPKAQLGNPKPRLFRVKTQQALINRMGFNNIGINALVDKISVRQEPGILGVNIGKNKETSLENAAEDYQICLKAVFPYADYVTINISSPNTLNLRKLQCQSYLQELLFSLNTMRKQLGAMHQKHMPLLVKTSVDLPVAEHVSFVQTVMDNEIDGLIISNTTTHHAYKENGGLSGAPLRLPTSNMIQSIAQLTSGKLPIVGVGGILNASDAAMHMKSGATLLQILTGFVYRGPELLQEILKKM
ncbi:MAG: hypothetical protein ACD_29C00131G0001 [uncultured bacterium]|nr:MAG: hypothetical protein ACD_29C00131G0001 [uncultured bacterium]